MKPGFFLMFGLFAQELDHGFRRSGASGTRPISAGRAIVNRGADHQRQLVQLVQLIVGH
jgi:hypothetical protein